MSEWIALTHLGGLIFMNSFTSYAHVWRSRHDTLNLTKKIVRFGIPYKNARYHFNLVKIVVLINLKVGTLTYNFFFQQ